MARIMLITAHPGDFVWRAAGTIAVHTAQGIEVEILALTIGARGESPKLWTGPEVTIDEVRQKRIAEAKVAAELIGAKLTILENEDFPLEPTPALLERVAAEMRRCNPAVILTHTSKDPSNLDHVVTHDLVVRARMMVSSPGRGLDVIKPPKIICFEPHYPEQSGFMPNLMIDITSVWDIKRKAIEATPSQSNLWGYYLRLAEQRGAHAGVAYAEAFQRLDADVRSSIF